MENNALKFSIVVPTFNRSELLKEAIASVIQQTHTNWELIIIDDGGTDDTPQMVAEFEDDRIQYFWQENTERGAARNAGVGKANGDYVFFLDSDDFILPDYLEYAVELIASNNNPRCVHIPYILTDGINLGESADLRDVPRSLWVSNKFACQIILRIDMAKACRFSSNRELKIGEDWLLMIQLSQFKWIIGTRKLGRIRQHQGRTMHFPSLEAIEKSKQIIKNEVSWDEKYVDFSRLFRNIDVEFGYLEILSLIHQAAPKKEIRKRLKKLIALNAGFVFSKRFVFVMKHLIFPK